MTGLTLAVGDLKIIFNMSGWGWFIPFVLSLLILLNRNYKMTFPFFIWLPWIAVVLIYLFLSDYNAWQRSAQLLCPLVVGMAASSFRLTDEELSVFINHCHYLAIVLLIFAGIKSGLLLTGQLPAITGLAPEVMTAALLATLFATQYSMGVTKAMLWWSLMAFLPFVALTRTAIVANGLTMPLNFGPLKFSKRLILIAMICIIGVVIFYSPRVQHKMFYSGKGEMSDILSEDFRTTGRYAMWKQFEYKIRENPWFGYGVGAGEEFAARITGHPATYPHNDWYLSLYDYGVLGTSIFAVTILLSVIHLYRRSFFTQGNTKCLLLTGASSFIPFVLFMFTDNIMVYASFFGNLQFTIIGIAYGAYNSYFDDYEFHQQ